MKTPVRVPAVLVAATCLGIGAASTVHAQGAARVDGSVIAVSVGAGARAFGMGGAFIAIADDATAASWNPAGLAVLEKPEGSIVYKGMNRLTYDTSPYSSSSLQVFPAGTLLETNRADSAVFRQTGNSLEFASVTYPFRSGSVKIVPQLSYQRVIDLDYDTVTPRARNTTRDQQFNFGANRFRLVQDFRNETFAADTHGGIDLWSGSLAIGFTPRIYVGAALNLWRQGAPGNTHYASDVRYQSGTAGLCAAGSPCGEYAYSIDTTYEDSFSGFNVAVGALFKPVNRVRIGAVYKSGFDMTLRSVETLTIFAPLPTSAPAQQHSRIYTQIDSNVTWPRTLGGGVSVTPTDRLTLSADYTTTQWSKASAESTVVQEDLVAGTTQTSTASGPWPGTFDPRAPVGPTNQPQRDTAQLRFGGEYLFGGKLGVPVRAGFFRDRGFVPSPAGDDVTATGVTFGAGVVWSQFAFDVAYVYQGTSLDTSFVAETQQRSAEREDTTKIHKLYASLIVRLAK